jgi:hypothetical protein
MPFVERVKILSDAEVFDLYNPPRLCISMSIRALKLAHFNEFFNNLRIRNYVEQATSPLNIDEVQELIDGFEQITRWIYSKDYPDGVLLFSSKQIAIDYLTEKEQFSISVKARNEVLYLPDSISVMQWCADSDANLFFLNGYDFLPGVLSILNFIEELETSVTPHEEN